MSRTIPRLFVLFLASTAVFLLALTWRTSQTSALDKVDAWVLDTAANQPTTEFLVYLTEQGDISEVANKRSQVAKGTYVYEQLRAIAQQSQAPIIQLLEDNGANYRQYWVVNMIWVEGDMSLIQTLAQRDDVAHLYANPTIAFETPDAGNDLRNPDGGVEWNVAMINAPDVWAMGVTGEGAVVGGQDTGYEWTHAALQNSYRGWDGQTADHDYNWHDSIHAGGGSCGADSPQPCDDHNHGTHTMGSMTGDDGGSNQIGVAPGADWVACRNMDVGNGTPASYTECYEWFIAPYPVGGDPLTDGDPSKAPHAINNSWSCPGSEGCSWDTLQQVTENVRAAGIFTSHSAGNSGPSCNTVNTPSAIYDASFSVGATNSSDTIAGFSSRGTVTVDGSNRMKPDISAPGQSVRSAIRNGSYASFSGTSMASPHVVGLVALMISASPDLAGNVDLLEQVIQDTAVPHTSSQGCGGDGSDDVPNNVYGYGRIDALAAYNAVRHHLNVDAATSDYVLPGSTLTYTLNVSHTHINTQTNNVTLVSHLPQGTSFVSSSQPHVVNGDMVTWEAGTMPQTGQWQVDLVVQLDMTATGDITLNNYYVSSDEVATPEMGTAVTTPIIPHALDITLHADTAVTPGGHFTYTFTVTNMHPYAAAHDLMLTSELPANATFVSATGDYMQNGNSVEWQATEMAPDSTWTVHLVLQAPTDPVSITNGAYGVQSQEVTTAVTGPDVVTAVTSHTTYLPLLMK